MAKGYIGGKEVATDSVTTPGETISLKLKIDESGRKPESGCNDAVFVYASLVDANGTTVPVNDVPVTFSIEGDARILNPGMINTEAGIASALIRIGDLVGKIKITASDPANHSGELTFTPL